MPATETKAAPSAIGGWLQDNTIMPAWLPKGLRHPISTYIFAALVQGIAIAATVGLVQIVPDFAFRGAFILLGVIVVAATVGGAPGLFASLVGTLLLDFALEPPTFTFAMKKGSDVLAVVFYFIVCLATNLAASHAQRQGQPVS
jgi:K+-sensing histidine kinase KdpD